jgi:DNA-directed RNA polymerase specialized sigma subunit
MYDCNELLAKWDIRIKNTSKNLYHHHREIMGYSVDDNDIAQQLRMSLVRAVDKYDNEKGDIENYINRTLKYECILVLQEQHRDLP